MTTTSRSSHGFFRKSLVIPTEHGAWSWLLVPWLYGAVVAFGHDLGRPAPHAALALALTLIGGLSAAVSRQPATAWARIRQGRGRAADAPIAAGWALGLALLALLCLLGLLALDRRALAGLIVPFAAILPAYLLAARSGRSAMRSLGMELVGAVGLALTAPAAAIAVTARLDTTTIWLWILFALQNALGVLYVRQRLAHSKQHAGEPRLTLLGHLAGFAAVFILAAGGWIAPLAAAPFALLLLRALWAVRGAHPVADIKRFGFSEVAAELLGGALIAAALL